MFFFKHMRKVSAFSFVKQKSLCLKNMIQAVVNIKTKKLYLLTQFSATVLSQMMKSCRRRMQNGKSLQQPLCAMKSRCTYQISMSSIKRAGSMDSNQHRHASIKKKIMQHSATETRCFLVFFVFFLNHWDTFQIPILPPLWQYRLWTGISRDDNTTLPYL